MSNIGCLDDRKDVAYDFSGYEIAQDGFGDKKIYSESDCSHQTKLGQQHFLFQVRNSEHLEKRQMANALI